MSLDAARDFLSSADNEVSRQFPSKVALEALAPLISYSVNVTNTGSMDADHVVLGMLVPPEAGQNGVPLQTLWGFERVHVKAGQTVTVNMYPALDEFTRVDETGARLVHPGSYTFRFGIPEMPANQGYLEHIVETF